MLADARLRAAALLGVGVNASPNEVEGALQTQLRALEAQRGDMPAGAERERREALERARDLLVRRPGRA
jgi:hypothetical protein